MTEYERMHTLMDKSPLTSIFRHSHNLINVILCFSALGCAAAPYLSLYPSMHCLPQDCRQVFGSSGAMMRPQKALSVSTSPIDPH